MGIAERVYNIMGSEVKVTERRLSCELDCSWTSEGIWTKIYRYTYLL